MNVYIVSGKPTDGTYMYRYCQSVVVVAKDEQHAIKLAYDDGELHGGKKDYIVNLVRTDLGGAVIDRFYTQDY